MPRPTRGLPLLATLTLIAGLAPAVLGGPTAVADTAPVEDHGSALPPLWEPDPPYRPVWQASPGYVLHGVTRQAEGEDRKVAVIRLSDGAELGPYAPSSLSSGTALAGSSYLTEQTVPGSTVTSVTALDLGTGTTSTTTVPDGYDVLHLDEGWTLARVGNGHGYDVHVLRPDGSTDVTAGAITWNASYVGGDAHTAYLQDPQDVFRVDVDGGTVTTLARPADGWGDVIVTPNRVFNRREARSNTVPSPGTESLTWWDRSGTLLGSTSFTVDDVGYGDEWLPFGDRLLYVPQNPVEDLTHPVYPVDLAGGGLEAPLASDVVDADATGDGGVVLVRANHPAGSVSVVHDDGAGLRFVTDLPRRLQKFTDLRLVGDVIRGKADGVPVSTVSHGPGDWAPADIPYAESGDVTLVDRGQNSPDLDHTFDVTWSDGQRQVSDIGPRLGHGGRLLSVTLSYQADAPTEVQDAQTGARVALLPAGDSFAMDQSWVWSLTPTGTLTGHDATGASADVTLETGLTGSHQELRDVRGRFALVKDGYDSWVIDTHDVVPTWKAPSWYSQLGDGFVATTAYTQVPGRNMYDVRLRVVDVAPPHNEHDFPGLQGGLTNGPKASFSVDDADTWRVAYVDNYGQPKMADLDWLSAPPEVAPDTQAPTLLTTPDPAPQILRSADPLPVTWSWSYRDDERPYHPASGIASYEMQFRPQPTSLDTTAAWTAPPEWQTLSDSTVTRTLQPGTGGCVRARARDVAGNVSEWSGPFCRFVDGQAPVPVNVASVPRVSPHLYDTVTWSFRATDDDRVTSYDVQYRLARRGEASYSTWRTAGSPTSPFTFEPTPGQDVCMRFRGHDPAGRVGAWSKPRCRAVAVDANTWYAPADTISHVSDKVIGQVYLEMGYPGTTATMAKQGGRAIALQVVRGPGLGVGDVYFAGRKLTRLHFEAPTRRIGIVVIPLPRRATGTVKIKQVGARHIRFGALAMLR